MESIKNRRTIRKYKQQDIPADLLNELHTYGSVRNLRDRRNDLYELKMKK